MFAFVMTIFAVLFCEGRVEASHTLQFYKIDKESGLSGSSWHKKKNTRKINRTWRNSFSAMDGESTPLPSNANNFHGKSNTSVDPRMGTASFNVVLASIFDGAYQMKRNLSLSYSGSGASL